MKVVILAGGSGTRLWPISRQSFPKQFLSFGGQNSLLQKTVLRFLQVAKAKEIVVVTSPSYLHLVQKQLRLIDPNTEIQVIVEPVSKNTAPAIALAIKYFQETQGATPSDTVIVTASDHLLTPEEKVKASILQANSIAEQGHLVTFGIRPHKPETGYGYIRMNSNPEGHVYAIEEFVEKPSYEKAMQFLIDGNYVWNAGIFTLSIATFWREIQEHAPEIYTLSTVPYETMLKNFANMPDISIDYAVMEKAKGGKVLPLDVGWSDVGSWDSVYEILDKDSDQNVKIGDVLAIDTKNSLLYSEKRLISVIGLEDVMVVETEDALFVAKKGHSQKVKQLVHQLKKGGKKESVEHTSSERPWGNFTILEEGPRYKIKKITVDPLQTLSLQMHYHRSEHWIVVRGTAKVKIGEAEKLLHENESIYVPQATVHSLSNPGKLPLEIIEVQVGEYLHEDDIIRFKDAYGRN